MLIEIVMPKMGESIMEGTIIKWYKKVGDFVKKEETIFEISTDKVDTEVPSSAEGTLVELLFNENDTVPVGTVVAKIETETADGKKDEERSIAAEKIDVKMKESTKKVDSEKGVISQKYDIVMPKMGESIMEGTVIKWHKKVGDFVKKEETIFEISTDKVDTEVPSAFEGTLIDILVNEQETAPVGAVVARIASGQIVSSDSQTEEDISMHSQVGALVADRGDTDREINVSEESKPEKELKSSRFLSPLVINIAKANNISIDELMKLDGSGIGGRVTKNDVLKYIEFRKSPSFVKSETGGLEFADRKKENVKVESFHLASVSASGGETVAVTQKYDYGYTTGKIDVIPMDNIRTKIMNHMIASRDTSVHVTEILEVDMSKIYNFIKEKKDAFLKNEGIKLTYTPFVAMASVAALKEFPLVNASIEGNNIIVKKSVNLGIAVALESNLASGSGGLIVPNIKNAEEKNLVGMARAISDLAERARAKKLSLDDISGGTFTITNYGVFGSLFGTPIINQPEVAILGMGVVTKRPVVIEVDGNDVIAIKPMMYLSLAHDHRLIDGMLGGRFAKKIKDYLENFKI